MTKKISVQVEKLGEYVGHKGSLYALAVDEQGGSLFSSGDDGIVARWNLNGAWDEGEALLTSPRAIYSLTHLSTHQILAAGSSEGILYLYHLEKKELIHSLQLGAGAIFDIQEDTQQQILWVLQGKGLLSAIQLPTMELMGQTQVSTEHLRAMVRGNTSWFIGSSDQHIHHWDSGEKKVKNRWMAHDSSVFSLHIHPNGHQLLSGGRDAHLKVWNIEQEARLEKSLPAHMFTINDICFSPDQQYFLTASRDKTIKLWDGQTFDLLKVIDGPRNHGHKHSVNKLLWLTADNSVLSCSDDRRLIRWRLTIEHV
ncbi:MAG: hypothetical protein AAF587_40365 [Bacteroidota bacterium]